MEKMERVLEVVFNYLMDIRSAVIAIVVCLVGASALGVLTLHSTGVPAMWYGGGCLYLMLGVLIIPTQMRLLTTGRHHFDYLYGQDVGEFMMEVTGVIIMIVGWIICSFLSRHLEACPRE